MCRLTVNIRGEPAKDAADQTDRISPRHRPRYQSLSFEHRRDTGIALARCAQTATRRRRNQAGSECGGDQTPEDRDEIMFCQMSSASMRHSLQMGIERKTPPSRRLGGGATPAGPMALARYQI